MGALAKAARLIGFVASAGMAASAAGILASLGLIAWSVVMRYVFHRPPVWVDDVIGFLLVGIVMLAAAQTLRNGEHIAVDVLTAKLGPRAQRWARAVALASVLAVCAILIGNGWQTAMFSRQLGILTEGYVEIPAYLLQLLLPAGGVMMGAVALEQLALLGAAGTAESSAGSRAPERAVE